MPRSKPAPAAATAPATPAPPPAPAWRGPLRPRDLGAYGRRVGAEYRSDPRHARRVEQAALLVELGLQAFDPEGLYGAGYRVYSALYGEPDEHTVRAAYPLHRLPAEVVDFWAEWLTAAGSRTVAVMIADDPRFVAGFLTALTD